MTIQWYPGHMHKAQKEIKQALPNIDLIIEILDARIPHSSSNPVIGSLAELNELPQPVIKIINKTDLADPALTQDWRDYFESQKQTKALPLCAHKGHEVSKITALVRKLVPSRVAKNEPVRAMIMGIPNVGKSTLINALADRSIAKVGNEPAVTQRQQRIDLDDSVVLIDTPGILWPKIENTNSSYRLAITGAIKDTVLEYTDIAFYLLDYLLENYPNCLIEKYQLDQHYSQSIEIAEAIGIKRGCLKAGGQVELDRVCKILINDYRNAKLGDISLETPAMIEKEMLEVVEKNRLKKEKDAARKQNFKKRKR